MGIMQKLATAFRGGLRESAEVVIDTQGLRIFAQEIHECEENIKHSKTQLASILAEKVRIKRELDSLLKVAASREEKVAQLLQANNETEALRVAELIAANEPTLKRQEQHYQQLSEHASGLQQNLKKMVNRLESYRNEYHMLKSTENLQSAQRKLSTNSNSTQSRFGDMQSSLERIQQRQQQFTDQMDAMQQVDDYLGEKNSGATNLDSAKDILEAIRKQQGSGESSS